MARGYDIVSFMLDSFDILNTLCCLLCYLTFSITISAYLAGVIERPHVYVARSAQHHIMAQYRSVAPDARMAAACYSVVAINGSGSNGGVAAKQRVYRRVKRVKATSNSNA